MTSDQLHVPRDQLNMISGQFEKGDGQNWSQNQLVMAGHDQTGHGSLKTPIIHLKKKRFALKVVECDLAANEINIIKMLDHEHILKYWDDFKSESLKEHHCVVTEHCEVKSHTNYILEYILVRL